MSINRTEIAPIFRAEPCATSSFRDGLRLAHSFLLMTDRRGLAELLEPSADLEFGPTVAVSHHDEPEPPSIRTSSQLVTPIAFAPPTEATKRKRAGFFAEIVEAWNATSGVLDETVPTARLGPVIVPLRALVFYRRLRAFAAFWDWDRDDVLRGAFIGGFVLVAVLASVSALPDAVTRATASEMRPPRTLEQHTPMHATVRGRARR